MSKPNPAEAFLPQMINDTAQDLVSSMVWSERLFPTFTVFDDVDIKPLTESIRGLIAEMHKAGRLEFVGLPSNDDQLVGYIAAIRLNDKHTYITRLYVSPQFRGMGAAKTLLKHASDRYETMTLVCSDSLVGLYEKAGFVFKGRYDRKDAGFSINDSAFSGLCVMKKNASGENDKMMAFFRLLDSDILPHVSLVSEGGAA